jgi:hypothetical protein
MSDAEYDAHEPREYTREELAARRYARELKKSSAIQYADKLRERWEVADDYGVPGQGCVYIAGRVFLNYQEAWEFTQETERLIAEVEEEIDWIKTAKSSKNGAPYLRLLDLEERRLNMLKRGIKSEVAATI